MTVSEYQRTQLFNWFEEHMGKERATTMMNLLPPVGWGDVATRRDLEHFEERLLGKIDSSATRLDGKIDIVAQRLDARIDRVEVRLDKLSSAMGGMATKADLADSQRELARTLVTWIFMAQATVVGAIGLLIAYLR
jgi:hypothetical protein